MKMFRNLLALTLCCMLGILANAQLALAQEKGDKDKVKGDKDKVKVLEVGKDGLKIDGEFKNTDAKDTLRKGSFAKIYRVKMVKGKTYTINMDSGNLDSWLRLEDSKGTKITEDDDSGGGLNSLIEFKCPDDGVYRVVATTFNEGETGEFTLRIAEK